MLDHVILLKQKTVYFFAVNTYYHPEDAVIAFLRYIPCVDGDRELNGTFIRKLIVIKHMIILKRIILITYLIGMLK